MSIKLRVLLILLVAATPVVALIGCGEDKPVAQAAPPPPSGEKDPGPATAFPSKPASTRR